MSEAVLFPKTLQKHMLMFSTTKLARNSCNKLVKAESSTLRYNDRLIPSLDNTIPCKTLQHLPFRFFPITWVTSHNHLNFNFNSIQDEGGKKPPISFSPVTSTSVGINLQNFLTFSFNPFATLV